MSEDVVSVENTNNFFDIQDEQLDLEAFENNNDDVYYSDVSCNSYGEIDEENYKDDDENHGDEDTRFTTNTAADIPSKINKVKVDNNINFLNEIRHWAIKYKIPLNALAVLLNIFIKYVIQLSFLPKDPRTFLKTARKTNIVNVTKGTYWHYDLNNIIEHNE